MAGVSCAAFAAATVVLNAPHSRAALLIAVVVGTLVVALRLMPAPRDDAGARTPPPRWDIPARMIVATILVLGLTSAAPRIGARLTGLLAPFPLYAAILTVFAHELQGATAATAVVRGLLLGLFGFAGFFFVLATMIERLGGRGRVRGGHRRHTRGAGWLAVALRATSR